MAEGAIFTGFFLFFVGIIGFFVRKNILVILMAIEVMLAGANLVILGYGVLKMSFEAHVFVLLVIALAAAEVGVGLAIAVHMKRTRNTLDIEGMRRLGE